MPYDTFKSRKKGKGAKIRTQTRRNCMLAPY